MGQQARFERFAAEMMYILAAGKQIDMDRVRPFAERLDDIYANPFEKKRYQPETAEEIKQYILDRLEALINGSNDAGREDYAG